MKISYGKCALRMAFQIIVFSMFILGNADASRQVLDDSDVMNYTGIWNESDIANFPDFNLNYGIQSVDPLALFSLRIGSGVKSNNDSITSGWYSMGQGYSLSIENINDTTNTVLGNLQYTLQADNISGVSYPEYANWNSSYAKWVFPEKFSLDEEAGLRVDAGKRILNGHLPMSVNRKFNKSIFIEDGYQLAEFNFTFDDKNYIPHGGEIHALEISTINASLVLDTFFTDAPLNEKRPFSRKNEHAIDFLFNTSKLQEKKTYNISIVIKVDLKNNNHILYKPYYGVWIIYNGTQAPDQIGNTATIPNEMLTADVHYASVSTNISNRWIITRYYIRSAGLYGIIQNQFIRDLKIEPTTSINPSNPLIASAIVSGENLSRVNFGIVDLNNLLSDNMTLLGVDINSSGLNGRYSASWYANSFSIKKGNSQEIITAGIFNQSSLLDHYGVIGFFKKNYTTDEVNAILWFDRTTGVLSKISKYDEAFSPLSIENGSSDFKVTKFKFLKGSENFPSSVNGSTYTLFNISSLSNPSLISTAVPNGVYRAFILVMDKIGNNQGEFMDVEVSSYTSTVSFDNSNINLSLICNNKREKRLNLILDKAPEGLSRFNITVSLSNKSIAEMIFGIFPEWAVFKSNSSFPSDSAWLNASDLSNQIQNNATNVVLANLTVRGKNQGSSIIYPHITMMEDDNGKQINAKSVPSQINVLFEIPLPCLICLPPIDLDNDCICDDINGNGRRDFNDIVLFFNYLEWISGNEPIECFDCNGNGRIDFNDIICLFNKL